MRKKRRYYRKKINRRKKFYVKTIKVKNLYASIIIMLIILLIINIIKQDNINILDFILQNIVPSSSNEISDSKQNINKSETIKSSKNIISVIGVNDITYEDESDKQIPKVENKNAIPQTYDTSKFGDLDYLKNNFYIVDQRTRFTAEDFSAAEFLSKDLSINNKGNEPKVLIFHTHSHEGFSDSNVDNINDGIYGIGEMLANTLTNKYGIVTIHDDGRYDYVNGKAQIIGAYERMEPSIEKILADNPSIEVAIDLHRDGVPDTTRLVKNIDGKPTAQIMFFNGLCKYIEDGKLISGAKNPYLSDNLAFSFQLQLKSKELYPEFTRKIYLHAYRFSLHMKPRSLLIELGAQTNTMEEAKNAVEPLAKILSEILIK